MDQIVKRKPIKIKPYEFMHQGEVWMVNELGRIVRKEIIKIKHQPF